jgi:hypothetical protein
MRRLFSTLLIAALTAAAGVSGVAQAGSSQACTRGLKVAAQDDTHLFCSHGGDAADDLTDLGLPGSTTTPSPAPCIGDGTSGARIEVMYGVPSDVPNDYANKVASIRTAIDQADQYFEASDDSTTQHLRWLCSGGSVVVDNITLVPIGSDGTFTFQDLYNSLNPRGRGKKSSTTSYNSTSRVYVVFVDGLGGGSYSYCGQGTVDGDDSAASTNRNNVGPGYALIACWDGHTALHEIGHMLGAVQLSAPHSSGKYHCYDDADIMCYDDGGSYFAGPDGVTGTGDDRSMVMACAGTSTLLGSTAPDDTQFDCNEDDYYNPAPPAGSYLSQHWNIAHSAWVQG